MNAVNKKKIVFIINGVHKSRCLKRVEEFIKNGYEVVAYGFDRGYDIPNKSNSFHIEIIGHLYESYSYYKKIWIIIKALRGVFKKHRKENVLYYYFFMDIVLAAFFLGRKKYIYEESDIPYADFGNKIVRNVLRNLDKKFIKDALLTVVTSEGFIDYHFGNTRPSNIVMVPNRVNPQVVNYHYTHRNLDMAHLTIGFVGGIRYRSIVNFAKVFVSNYPNYHFHMFGDINQTLKPACDKLKDQFENIHFHGVFQNPQDLPSIYGTIDMVLATYDLSSTNVRYAEPNKLYESIYFGTPIIVSKGTFLSKKVESLGIGYSLNAMNDDEILSLIDNLSTEDLQAKCEACNAIPKEMVINDNKELFEKLNFI